MKKKKNISTNLESNTNNNRKENTGLYTNTNLDKNTITKKIFL